MSLSLLRWTICLTIAAAMIAAPASLLADEYVGWRTDGTGSYPDANPVTIWSAEENVIWATPMPGSSNSLPVIIGDRLFVCSEPSTLLCVDPASGEILWQASSEPADIAPAEEVADLEEKTAEYNRIRGELGRVNREVRNLRRQLQDDPDNATLRQQNVELRQRRDALQEQMAPYLDTWYVRPPAHDYNGYSSPTPVTDGTHVWAVFGNGIASCFDIDGNRVWSRYIDRPPDGWGTSNTPVLADGKLILHIDTMRALDPLIGEEIWAQPAARWNWGTSWVHLIDGVSLIITSNGDIVRATDGEILAAELTKLRWGSGPFVADGVLYYIDSQGNDFLSRAFRLPETLDEPFEPELLWEAQPKNERYYGSPVIHEGLIYAITQHNALICLDAETGEILYEEALNLGRGEVFASIVLAGGYLIATNENGTSIVFEPGPEYVEVARNELGDMVRSTPVFHGDLMYVRGYENLYCIGATAN